VFVKYVAHTVTDTVQKLVNL